MVLILLASFGEVLTMSFLAQVLLGLLGLDRLFELLLSSLLLAKFPECLHLFRLLLNFLCLVDNLGLVFVERPDRFLGWLRLGLGYGGLGILRRFACLACILLRSFFGLCSH